MCQPCVHMPVEPVRRSFAHLAACRAVTVGGPVAACCALLASVSCSTLRVSNPPAAPSSQAVSERYYGDTCRREPEIPYQIRVTAEAAYSQLDQPPPDRGAYIQGFTEGYLMGVAAAHLTVKSSQPGLEDGVRAGQAAQPLNRELYGQYMLAFGNTETTVTGTYSTPCGFECSDFSPDQVPEKWWLTFSVYCGEGARKKGRITVTGFLSPRGGYGHMNQYDRQFVAVSVKPAD